MNKPALSPLDRRKCIRTVKRLYNKFIMEFIQDTLKEMGLGDDGDLAMAQCSDGDGNDEDDGDENGHCDATSGAIGGGHGGVYLGTNDLNSDTIHQSLGTLGSLVWQCSDSVLVVLESWMIIMAGVSQHFRKAWLRHNTQSAV